MQKMEFGRPRSLGWGTADGVNHLSSSVVCDEPFCQLESWGSRWNDMSESSWKTSQLQEQYAKSYHNDNICNQVSNEVTNAQHIKEIENRAKFKKDQTTIKTKNQYYE